MIVMLCTTCIVISCISAQEQTTDSALRATHSIANHPTDKNRSLSTNYLTSASVDATMALNKECVRFDLIPPPYATVLRSFKVKNLIDCWRYCRLIRGCEVFSFRYSTRRCSIFPAIYSMLPRRSSRSPLAVGARQCLAAVVGVDEVVRTSQDGGILIENKDWPGKCLFATQIPVNLPKKYGIGDSCLKLTWVTCNEASIWVINQIDASGMVRISLVNTDWSLEWKEIAAGTALVYLAHMKNIKYQFLMLKEDKQDFGFPFPPYFDLFGPRGSKWIPVPNVDEILSWSMYESLHGIILKLPFSIQTCSLRSMSVRHGLVPNKDKVPFFLEGSTVTVVCQRGYGVRLLNYTSHQVVRCNTSSESRQVKPCSLIRGDEDSVVMCSVYQALTISLSVILLVRLCYQFSKRCKREESNSENVCTEDQQKG